jgi:hypothetical protein
MAAKLPREEGNASPVERCPAGEFGRLAAKLRHRRQRRQFLRGAAGLTTFLAAGGGLWLWLRRSKEGEPSFGGITCAEVQGLAPAYGRGELTAPRREQVRQHLAQCLRCAERFRLMGLPT